MERLDSVRDDDAAGRHARYHRTILGVACGFAALGVALGLVTPVVMATQAKSAADAKGILLAPAVSGVGGFNFGMAAACVAAPRAFLTGPVGRPWMARIGTTSVMTARVACLAFGLVLAAPFVATGVAIARSP